MPLLLIVIPLAILAGIALLPFGLIQRFRRGTARRTARGWVASINLAGVTMSALMVVGFSAIATRWVPGTLTATLGGLLAGCALGIVGAWLTRWEQGTRAWHYTPSAWIVLPITLIVAARVAYGFWRSWQTWNGGDASLPLIAASGIAASTSAGAVVLGYYMVFWAAVKRRLRRR